MLGHSIQKDICINQAGFWSNRVPNDHKDYLLKIFSQFLNSPKERKEHIEWEFYPFQDSQVPMDEI